MSTNSLGDPRSGRDRRAPTRKHAFERGTVDPITTHKRPLFTIGNGILLVAIIGYGMYATGHLPQLDAFFDNADKYGKAHNSTVVNGLLTYGAYLFFAVIAGLVGLIIFGFVNANNRRHTDRRASEIEDRRKGDRRRAPREDMPSLVMPLGKERPMRRSSDKPATPAPVIAMQKPKEDVPVTATVEAKIETPAAETTPAAAEAKPFFATSDNSAAKAEAMAAAAKAEEVALHGPTDPSSFVPMPGKERLRPTKVTTPAAAATPVEPPKPAVAAIVEAAAPLVATTPAPTAADSASQNTKPAATDTSLLSATPASAAAEAALAAAKAAALKAEAAIAAAKAEAAIAHAKAEAAAAEAAAAAAKAASLTR